MNRTTATMVAAFGVVSSVACADAAVPTADVASSDDVSVLYSELEQLGFADHDSIAIHNKIVMVNGDIRFDRAALAAGEYTQQLAADGPVVYGYHNSLVSRENVGNIGVMWATDDEWEPTPLLRDAVDFAVTEWNTPIKIGPSNDAADLAGEWGAIKLLEQRARNDANIIIFHTVETFDFYNSVDSPCGATLPIDFEPGDGFTLACAEFPRNGYPGRHVWIPEHLPGHAGIQVCDWTKPLINRTLIHEVGHALGFSHPHAVEYDDAGNVIGRNTHVAGTGVENDGTATIMSAFVPPFPACGTDFWGLQRDDILTAVKTYPK